MIEFGILEKFIYFCYMKKQLIHNLITAIGLLCVACTHYSPKPAGYYRIDLPEPAYHWQTFPAFDCLVSEQAQVTSVPFSGEGDFFNLTYPLWNAQIHCSYLIVKKNNWAELSEESRKLVYLHTVKADAILERPFENRDHRVFGILYDIRGNVASPTQFVLTDSVRSFFRGALYFDNRPNSDSIAPVLEYINNDIQVLIESVRWKQ